jgi:hypothetical protein
MNTHKQTLFQAVLARISLGAVPVDGSYWFDAKDAGATKSSKPARLPDADWSPVSLSLSRPFRRS